MSIAENILQVDSLTKEFPIYGGFLRRQVGAIRAVNSVSLKVGKGRALGLAGESGCGKTTTGRMILRLIEPTSGSIHFDGVDILRLPPKRMRELRRLMQIIFQDPLSSLNPRLTIKSTLTEPRAIHQMGARAERVQIAVELLERVGLSGEALSRYPHQFSGGQRQRIGIARALALNPKFILADEPVSALDVSVQAQIINLLIDLKEREKISYLFISHDLAAIEFLCEDVAIMYLGSIVESGPTPLIYSNPRHPYTEALLAATLLADPKRKRKPFALKGEIPSPSAIPPGCAFHPRCPIAEEECARSAPLLENRADRRALACHLR